MKTSELTIEYAQANQPWTVAYSTSIALAHNGLIPHILASHNVLHAAKSVGKIAAVFEELDHSGKLISPEQIEMVKAMSADLLQEALRFANLLGFDLASIFVARVEEKNGINLLNLDK